MDFGLARRLGVVGELREILGTPEYVGKLKKKTKLVENPTFVKPHSDTFKRHKKSRISHPLLASGFSGFRGRGRGFAIAAARFLAPWQLAGGTKLLQNSQAPIPETEQEVSHFEQIAISFSSPSTGNPQLRAHHNVHGSLVSGNFQSQHNLNGSFPLSVGL